jgi:lambda family phage portal protein
MRLKTPSDFVWSDKIRDGVELDSYGAPIAYWIKKSEKIMGETADISKNFVRVRAFKGNRQNVLHVYYQKSPEQVRGIPFFAPAIKFFRDMLDYLDAELVSNVVTAAYSMFVEVEDIEPEYPSAALADFTRTVNLEDGSSKEERYEELVPGTVSYLNPGEKPHFSNPTRPGSTFEPFIQVIAESIAMAVDIPQPVLFNSFRGMNFASYRSAMLEAWRVFSSQRQMFGRGFCSAPYRMLQEEAYLRNDINFPLDFYSNMYRLTGVDWIGPPKGQIEPVKEDQADEKKIAMRVKSRQMKSMEMGHDWESVLDQIEDEEKEIESRGLIVNPDAKYGQNEETSTGTNEDES